MLEFNNSVSHLYEDFLKMLLKCLAFHTTLANRNLSLIVVELQLL